MFSHLRKHSDHPQHHHREELGGDFVLLSFLSAEAVFWNMQHFTALPCCPSMMLKVTVITKLNQI